MDDFPFDFPRKSRERASTLWTVIEIVTILVSQLFDIFLSTPKTDLRHWSFTENSALKVYDCNIREKFNTITAIAADIQVWLVVNFASWIPANGVIYTAGGRSKFALSRTLHGLERETSRAKRG